MKFKRVLDSLLERILVAIMAIMVVNVLWQVASRFVLQSPSSFTDELARYLLIWLSILGASYVTGKRMHLSIDLLIHKIADNKKDLLNTVIYAIVAFFSFLVMVVGGSRLVYIVLPIGGLIIIFYSIINIIYPRETEDRSISESV